MRKRNLEKIAVFCGSNLGNSPAFSSRAKEIGTAIAERHVVLVCGGTNKGLMADMIDASLKANGSVVGVVPQKLFDQGQMHPRMSVSEIAPTMQARKEKMFNLADAFVALPGGIGTIQELTEVITLNQLGQMDKPLGLLNVDDYFDGFMNFLDAMIAKGFLPAAHKAFIAVDEDPNILLDKLHTMPPISGSKWLK